MWRAFYAPRTRKEKQILPMSVFESVEAIRGYSNIPYVDRLSKRSCSVERRHPLSDRV